MPAESVNTAADAADSSITDDVAGEAAGYDIEFFWDPM